MRRVKVLSLIIFILVGLLTSAALRSYATTSFAEQENSEFDNYETISKLSANGIFAVPIEEKRNNANKALSIPEIIPIAYETIYSFPDDVPTDVSVYINNYPFASDNMPFVRDGSTYVPLGDFVLEYDKTATVEWKDKNSTVKISGNKVALTLHIDDNYLEINGRYLYLPQAAIVENGVAYVPIRILEKALCADIVWDSKTKIANFIFTGDELLSGDKYYDKTDIYWLSRIVYAESGIEPLEGQIAVANVVLNRVADSYFPDTIKEVIYQHNGSVYQFSPAKFGTINKKPSEESVIAAKLALDGANIVGTCLYFQNDAIAETSWMQESRTYVYKIGHHSFYA